MVNILVQNNHGKESNEGTSFVFFTHSSSVRLCRINLMTQLHSLHQHFIHYHDPFNKLVKCSFCQMTLMHCAWVVLKKKKTHHLIGKQQYFSYPVCSHIVSRHHMGTSSPIMFITRFVLLSTHATMQALQQQYLHDTYSERYRVLLQEGKKKLHCNSCRG